MFKRLFVIILVVLSMVFSTACASQQSVDSPKTSETPEVVSLTEELSSSAENSPAVEVAIADTPELAEYTDYLDENYAITLKGTISHEDFAAAATAILGALTELPEGVDAEGFTPQEMIISSLYYINLDELGHTYPDEKVTAVLADWPNIPADLSIERKKEMAAAISSGLIDKAWMNVDMRGAVDSDMATVILGRILKSTGNYKNFLGSTDDSDILNKVMHAWKSFDLVTAPELEAKANKLIKDGTITGYNIKRWSSAANGDSDRTMLYGHSDIDHARQLIELIKSEDLTAKVMLEPKTSSYLFLADWGEPIPSPEFGVIPLKDGNFIVSAKEFDLIFEFNSKNEKEQFDSVILSYAKKDESGQPNLLYSSWFTPLYVSTVSAEDFKQVKNHIASLGSTFIQSFGLVEDSENTVAKFKKAFEIADIYVMDIWVNDVFYGYLKGE